MFFKYLPFLCQIEASGNSREKVLVFFKLHPTVITEDNLHQSLLVSSMLDSPINTLYQAVRQVFAPVLLKVNLPLHINYYPIMHHVEWVKMLLLFRILIHKTGKKGKRENFKRNYCNYHGNNIVVFRKCVLLLLIRDFGCPNKIGTERKSSQCKRFLSPSLILRMSGGVQNLTLNWQVC